MAATPLTFGIIIISVLMNAGAQLLLSVALKGENLINPEAPMKSAIDLALNPGVVLAMASYAFSILLWMYVLSKADVSLAYPFLGLGFAFVAVFSFMFLGEPLSFQKAAGIVIISLGIVVLARS